MVVGILGVDAALDRMARRRDQPLRIEVERLAAGDPYLPPHEIDAGHHFRDRMLDLQARVHLQEVEGAVVIEKELDRAGVRIADRAGNRGCGLRHGLAEPLASTAIDGVSSTTF